jgi:exocyst complex component 4
MFPDVLKYIQSDWPFMGGEECIPVQVALQLSDPSTLGLATREPEFKQAHKDLQKSLKSIVNGMRFLASPKPHADPA